MPNSAAAPLPVSNATFANAIEQLATAQTDDQLLAIGQTAAAGASTAAPPNATTTTQYTDDGVLDSTVLANLSPQALTLLNEAQTGAAPNTTGGLTSIQLQEIATLAHDAQMLNGPQEVTYTSAVPAPDSASTVNLSIQAASLLNEVIPPPTITAPAPATLTATQLQQIAGVITPFINAPLTPAVLTQMQTTLTAAGFNPTTLSLQSYLLSMNYISAELPVPVPEGEQQALNESMETEFNESEFE